jgi:hypothetical protein
MLIFGGFVVVLAVCVAFITVNILTRHYARRHLREIRGPLEDRDRRGRSGRVSERPASDSRH